MDTTSSEQRQDGWTLAHALEQVKSEIKTQEGPATPTMDVGESQNTLQRPRVYVKVEQASDGGWPEEYQPIRSQSFDQAEYERLHSWFFTKCNVTAGSHESLTRNGTLRMTERVTRQKLRIDEWPELREHIQTLTESGHFSQALGHLRCLQHYLQGVDQCVPRILRDPNAGRRSSAVAEMLDVAADDGQSTSPAEIDLEDQRELAHSSSIRIKTESELRTSSDSGAAEGAVAELPQPSSQSSTTGHAAVSPHSTSQWSFGALVWAKMGVYPYWPAEVTSLDVLPEGIRARLTKSRRSIRSSNAILVEQQQPPPPLPWPDSSVHATSSPQFYQSNDVAWVMEDKVAPYSSGSAPPDGKSSKSAELRRAIEEVELEVTLRHAEQEFSSELQPDCTSASTGHSPRGHKREADTEDITACAQNDDLPLSEPVQSVSPREQKRFKPEENGAGLSVETNEQGDWSVLVVSDGEDAEEEEVDLTQTSDEEEHISISKPGPTVPPTPPSGWSCHLSKTFSQHYFWNPRTNAVAWPGTRKFPRDETAPSKQKARTCQPLPSQSEEFRRYASYQMNAQSDKLHKPEGCKVFIGSLGGISDTPRQRQRLRKCFAKFGKLLEFKIILDSITKQSRGFAFATYLRNCDAEAACCEGVTVDGMLLTVRPALSEREDGVGGSIRIARRLFIGGIPSDLQRAELERYFGNYGDIETLEVPGENNGKRRGFAFISFATESAASECAQTSMHEISGHKVEVRRAIAQQSIAPGTRIVSGDPIKQRTVFVGNLAWRVSEEQLSRVFGQFGVVKSINIRQKFRNMPDKKGQRLHAAPNIAHIEFASLDSVERVVEASTAANTKSGFFCELCQSESQRVGLRIDRASGPFVEDTRPFAKEWKSSAVSPDCDISKTAKNVIDAMRSKPYCPYAQAKACRDLAMVVKRYGIAGVRAIVACEGVTMTAATLRFAVKRLCLVDTQTWGVEFSAEVCNASMMLLGKIAQLYPVFVQEIVEANVIPAIVVGLESYPDSVVVQSAGMYALWTFSLDHRSIPRMVSAGVSRLAETACNTVSFPARSAPHRWACLILDRITARSCSTMVPKAPLHMRMTAMRTEPPAPCTASGFPPDIPPRGIVVAMQQNSSDIQIQAHGCAALAELVSPKSVEMTNYRNTQRVVQAGGVQAVSSALKALLRDFKGQPASATNPEKRRDLSWRLAAEACSVMATVAAHEDAYQTAIFELGGVQATVKAVNTFIEAEDVAIQGLRMLSRMARLNAVQDKSYARRLWNRQQALDSAGVIEVTIRVMKNFNASQQVQNEGCMLFGNLMFRNAALRTRVARAGGMEVAISILQTFGEHIDTLKHGVQFVSRLIHRNATECFLTDVPRVLLKAMDSLVAYVCSSGLEMCSSAVIVRCQMHVINAFRDFLQSELEYSTSLDGVLMGPRQDTLPVSLRSEWRRALLAVFQQHTGQSRPDLRFLRANCLETLEMLYDSTEELSAIADEVKPMVDSTMMLAGYEYTKMCTHFLAGYCKYGTNCMFAHDESQLQWADRRHKETQPCRSMLKSGTCEFGDECWFSHDLNASQHGTICRFWLSNKCVHGATCNFVHGTRAPVEPCSYRRLDDGSFTIDANAVEKLVAKRVALMKDGCRSEAQLVVADLAKMGVVLDDIQRTWHAGEAFEFEFQNWSCHQCGNNNYDFRIQCHRCAVPKPRNQKGKTAHIAPESDLGEDAFANPFETLDYS